MYYELLKSDFFTKEEDREPEIGPFGYYVEAFWELSTCRGLGMDEGPIPFTAIRTYYECFPEENFYDFLGIIRTMDDAYISAKRAKKEREGKTNAGKKNRSQTHINQS